MSEAPQLCRRAQSLGLRLEADGGDLLVRPASKCPPDFASVLRRHKGELLNWLEARNAGLAPDSAAWLYVANQVLEGEFKDCDRSTCASLNIGLRSVVHPLCQRAIEKLRTEAKQR